MLHDKPRIRATVIIEENRQVRVSYDCQLEGAVSGACVTSAWFMAVVNIQTNALRGLKNIVLVCNFVVISHADTNIYPRRVDQLCA